MIEQNNKDFHIDTKRKVLFIILILVLCLLGLSAMHQTYSCSSVSTKDVVPQFSGDNVAPTATVTSVSYTCGFGFGSHSVTVAPISYEGVNVYLIPNGASYSIAWTANSDGFGLAPSQCGIAPECAPTSGCTEVTPQICVHATVQDTPEQT